MNKSRLLFILILIYYGSSCRDSGIKSDTPPKISAIDIKTYKTIMPHAKGYDTFETYCIACHSLRYIQMQPDLPEKKWQSVVDKMIKTFGAPIPDSAATQIVAYLTEVKGSR